MAAVAPPDLLVADLTPAELWRLLVDLHSDGVPLPPLCVAGPDGFTAGQVQDLAALLAAQPARRRQAATADE